MKLGKLYLIATYNTQLECIVYQLFILPIYQNIIGKPKRKPNTSMYFSQFVKHIVT